MRRITQWAVGATALAVLSGCATTVGTPGATDDASASAPASPAPATTAPSPSPTPSPSATTRRPSASPTVSVAVRPLGEIGPGACWQSDKRPSGGTDYGFAITDDDPATDDGPTEVDEWLRSHKNEAARYDRWLNSHKKYYLVTEVVSKWDKMKPADRTTEYISKLVATQLLQPLHVQNTSCKTAREVTDWEVQYLPVGEWVFFLPGHGPASKDVRPAFKAVSGSPLLLRS